MHETMLVAWPGQARRRSATHIFCGYNMSKVDEFQQRVAAVAGEVLHERANPAEASREVRFEDGRKFSVDDRVQVHTRYGTRGLGTVIGFGHAGTRVKLAMDSDAQWGERDRWPLNPEQASKHGHPYYERPRDAGVSGGEIVAHVPSDEPADERRSVGTPSSPRA
jgi:hypothetical protein